MARNVLIYLDKNALWAFVPGMTAVAKLPLSSNLIRDLEILDSEALAKELTEFKAKEKILPALAVLILSQNVTFDKNFTAAESDQEQSFLETLPFDEVGAKTVARGEEKLVVAANRNFYETFKAAWEKSGGRIKFIVPEQLLPERINLKSPASLIMFLKKQNLLRPVSLISMPEPRQQLVAENKNLRLLFPLLLVSLFVLVGVILWTLFGPKPASVRNIPVAPRPASPVATPAAQLTLDTVRVVILFPDTAAKSAQDLKTTLLAAGFKNTNTVTSTNPPAKTAVIFSPQVPTSWRETVVTQLAKVETVYLTTENTDSRGDIIILLTK